MNGEAKKVEMIQKMKKPFQSWSSNVKVKYKANNKSGVGIAVAFTADETGDGRVVLWKRNEHGGSDRAGYFNSIEEAEAAANNMLDELGLEIA